MPGKLYVVATPIGNLSDMTPRAVQVLSSVDMIAAEDTRHSRVLLSHFGIKTPSFSCHKFNEEKRGHFFVSAILKGKDVALISDAGTPSISDPGHRLVDMVAKAGGQVVAICGANAAAAALSVSAFDVSTYIFLGFLPRTQKEQAEVFLKVAEGVNCPAVFYESPLRVEKTLRWITLAYPNADICLANDLTKKFERVYRGRADVVLRELLENVNYKKGEYTCVVLLNHHLPVQAADMNATQLSLEAQLIDIMIKENCGLKQAINLLHALQKSTGKGNKKALYAANLRLKELFYPDNS